MKKKETINGTVYIYRRAIKEGHCDGCSFLKNKECTAPLETQCDDKILVEEIDYSQLKISIVIGILAILFVLLCTAFIYSGIKIYQLIN